MSTEQHRDTIHMGADSLQLLSVTKRTRSFNSMKLFSVLFILKALNPSENFTARWNHNGWTQTVICHFPGSLVQRKSILCLDWPENVTHHSLWTWSVTFQTPQVRATERVETESRQNGPLCHFKVQDTMAFRGLCTPKCRSEPVQNRSVPPYRGLNI